MSQAEVLAYRFRNNVMEQGPSSEANSHSASKEIPRF
jgi:hypothetical protein